MKTRRLVTRDEVKLPTRDGAPIPTSHFTRDARGQLLVMYSDGSWRKLVGDPPPMERKSVE